MSLLDDLAGNCCRVDYSMQSIVPEEVIETVLSESSERSSCPSPTKDYRIVANNIISPTKKTLISIGQELNQSSRTQQDMHFKNYREKVRKIDKLVSIISSKTIKLKYQVMVHLERQSVQFLKKQKQQQNQVKISEKRTNTKQLSTPKEPIQHKTMEQIIRTIEKRTREQLRIGFGGIKRKSHKVLKAQFLIESTSSYINRAILQLKRIVMDLMLKQSKRKCLEAKTKPTLSEQIRLFPLKNCHTIRQSLFDNPLVSAIAPETPQIALKPIFPHPREQQSFDFCDNMTLFMNEDEYSFFNINSSVNESFGPSCISGHISSSKKSCTSKSYIKLLSEVQFTTVPQSQNERRRVSDFTTGGFEEKLASNFSQIQIKRYHQSCVSPEKEQPMFSNDIKIPSKQEQSKQELSNSIGSPILLLSNLQERRLSIPEAISRSKSEMKVFRSERKSLSNIQNQIQKEYDEEMNRYLRFKKSLQERRDSTLKEIEKSQDTIKKLMVKFKKDKQKNIKLRTSNKCERSKEPLIQTNKNKDEKKTLISKTTPLKERSKSNGISQKISLKKDKELFQDIFPERAGTDIRYPSSINSPQNIDIYCQYMNQKKKMNSEKSTPVRKNSKSKVKGRESIIKSDKKKKSQTNQKNLMAISGFPVTKDHRVDLKVDLGKDSAKKGTPNGRFREITKKDSIHADRTKTRNYKKV